MQASTTKRVFRYKFSDEISQHIYGFAKLHQYDDRTTYKEAWKEWVATNEDEIRREIQRLYDLGYDGNIEDKMFKSGSDSYCTRGGILALNVGPPLFNS